MIDTAKLFDPLPAGEMIEVVFTPGPPIPPPTIAFGAIRCESSIAALFVATDLLPAPMMGERACRECGCTEFNACRHPDHGNCWWVEPNLCSHCANGWGDMP